MRVDAAVDANSPRLCTPSLLLIFCTTTPRVNPYPLDMIARPRAPCCCLETTPISALPADAPHRHARR